MKKIYNSTIDTLDKFRFNHCSTICPYKNGVFIASYAGDGECAENQKVICNYFNGEKYEVVDELEDGTGNPVCWNEKGKIVLLFSKFEKKTSRLVDMWSFCTNWLKKDNKIITSNLPVGMLARCQPIKYQNKLLIPLYFEHNCYTEIYEYNNTLNKLWEIGKTDINSGTRFGSGMLIQTTLYHNDEDLYSLSRDITRNAKAWFSKKTNDTWTKPVSTALSNYNNSIVAIHDNTENPLIIWNFGESRRFLILSRFNTKILQSEQTMEQLNTSPNGSYPNYCFDFDNNLHIIHTDGRKIRHHIWNM